MIRTTPFHSRLEGLNRTGLWSHWAGYLVADKYQMAEKTEYFAVRNSAGLFDTSPLYKYRFVGPGAESYLGGVLARDPGKCRPGRAQYTVWCDDDGNVLEDGVLLRLTDQEFLLSTARPNLGYFAGLVGAKQVQIEDVSDAYGALAVQGPRARTVLASLCERISELSYFDVADTRVGTVGAIVSRTGFTGDLGYEVWVGADDATELWDLVAEAAQDLGVVPIGQTALLMARIEAGLLLIDVDFKSSRFAWTDNERATPHELGLGWMIDNSGRPFVGASAIRSRAGTARWKLTGLSVDPYAWDKLHSDAGLIPPKDHRPVHASMMVYGADGEKAGWASSFMYSPMLQRHIALARVDTAMARPGNVVHLEVTIDHEYQTVPCETTRLPFYNPAHKTA